MIDRIINNIFKKFKFDLEWNSCNFHGKMCDELPQRTKSILEQ